MDHITSQLDQLADLSDEQISELQGSIVSEFETVEQSDPTPQSVDAMTSLADMLDTVRGEVARRGAQAEELANRAAEAAARVKGSEDKSEELEAPETEADPEVAPAEDEEAPIQASAATETESPVNTDATAEVVETADASAELAVEAVEVAEVEAPAEAEAELAVEEPVAAVEEAPEVAELAVEEPVVETADIAEATELAVEETPVEETTTEAELAVEAPAEAAVEAPAEAEASNSEETTIEHTAQEEAITVTAAAEEASFEAPADRRPVSQATVAPVAITAGADIAGYTAGSTLQNMAEVSDAMVKRIHALRRVNGGDGEQHIVASLTTTFPEEYTLGTDALANTEKIDAAVGPKALMASGGWTAPIQSRYEIFGFGTDARPVRDSLPRFQADRGGIKYLTPPQLSGYTAATGIWGNTEDLAAADNDGTGDTIKNSLTVGSATENTELTYAVTLQLQFGNLLTRSFPELIARHNELALIQHARLGEQTLLARIGSKSTAVTSSSVIGFARDFLVQVRRAAAAYRSRHRIDPSTQLRSIIPSWVYDAMAADLALSMPGDQTLGATRGDIDAYLALSNVTLTASLDQNVFGSQSTGALAEFPDSFTWYLFSEGSFLFLDGGTLDIGLIRDSGLVGTNDYKMFTETFEGLAFVGIESLAITSTINVNGAAAALRDTLGGVASATIEY